MLWLIWSPIVLLSCPTSDICILVIDGAGATLLTAATCVTFAKTNLIAKAATAKPPTAPPIE